MNLLNKDIFNGIQPSETDHVGGWHSNSVVFKNLIEQTRPKIIIEIGSWLGASAIHMAKIVKSMGLDTKIYCIDTWLGAEEFWAWLKHTPERDLKLKNGYPQVYFDFLSNVVRHKMEDIIIPIPNTSYIGYLILKHYNISADLIYVDGSHEYIDVKNDIIHFLNILNPNGIMFGDDYFNWQSVKQAVDETLGSSISVYENNYWIYNKN